MPRTAGARSRAIMYEATGSAELLVPDEFRHKDIRTTRRGQRRLVRFSLAECRRCYWDVVPEKTTHINGSRLIDRNGHPLVGTCPPSPGPVDPLQ